MSVINAKMMSMNAYKMVIIASMVANALIYQLIIHVNAKLVLPVDNAKSISTNAKVGHA